LNWAAGTLRELVLAVAEIFARRLGWDAERKQAALDAFARCAARIRDSGVVPQPPAPGTQ